MVGLGGRVVRGVGLGAATSGGTGIEAEVANQVLAGLGDVLGELGNEIQGVEDLEVTESEAVSQLVIVSKLLPVGGGIASKVLIRFLTCRLRVGGK